MRRNQRSVHHAYMYPISRSPTLNYRDSLRRTAQASNSKLALILNSSPLTPRPNSGLRVLEGLPRQDGIVKQRTNPKRPIDNNKIGWSEEGYDVVVRLRFQGRRLFVARLYHRRF